MKIDFKFIEWQSFKSLSQVVGLVIVCVVFALIPNKKLQGQIAPVQDFKKVLNLLDAIAENEALLAKYPDSDFTPNLMFQLVELYVQRARLNFQREMLIYEEAEKKFTEGLLNEAPIIPKLNFSDAVAVAEKILDQFPNISFRDKVIYRIALCYLEQGNQGKAFEYFTLLSGETENKQFLEEAHFRLGEYFFQQKDYQKAIEHYSLLLDSWDSPFFDMALYKLGWSYYNENDYSQAISTFIYLIEDINLLKQVETEYFGKTKADLRQEAKEYVAISFAEFGGAAKAKEFLIDKKEQGYTEDILLHMAEVYKKRNYYDKAVESLDVLLDFYPNKPAAAQYQKKIVENYELAGDKEKSTEARLDYLSKYGVGSEWLNRITEESVRREILAVSEEFLYSLGSEAQATAQESKSKLDYELAISRYRTFLDKFPHSDLSSKVLFYLAECLYEIENYSEAAAVYYELILNYPESEFRAAAAYNRILAYDKLLENNNPLDSTTLYLSNFLGNGAARVDTIQVVNHIQAQFLQASNDFSVFLAESPKLPEVLMKFAENLYKLNRYGLAQAAYQKVIDHASVNGFKPQAYTMLGQSAFKQENYREAEEWFQKLVKLYPDSTRLVERANKMIASSKFKIAENYLGQGDSTQAAVEFEKSADVVYDPEVAERALFEAAKLYENMGDKNKAIAFYEAIPKKYPHTKLFEQSLFKAGVLWEELEDWDRAAANYLALFEFDPASPFAAKSLFFAAKCYENNGNYDAARTYYGKYTTFYSEDTDRFLEAAFRKGEIAYNQKSYQAALKDLNFVIRSYQKFIQEQREVENYIPANAQFLIAEILYANFQKIKLTPPLEKKLNQKRAKFKQVIKAYTEAAKYKLAEWTTASSYKIGMTFEDFANALLESPRPRNLLGPALDEYNEKLWKSVLPLKEKALNTYQANVKQALEFNIQNKWITESKKRIEALTIELGRNTMELGQETGL